MNADSSRLPAAAEPGPQLPRRRFLQVIGLGLSSALGTPVIALAQGAGGAPPPPPPATTAAPPATTTPATSNEPPALSEDARDLAEIVRRRYGKHLTPEQLEAVTRELDQRVQGGRRLKDARLVNSDEPDFTFGA